MEHGRDLTGVPMFLGLGQGTTGTRSLHAAICAIKPKIVACHYHVCCPINLWSMRPHLAMLDANIHAQKCLDLNAQNGTGKFALRYADRSWNCDAYLWQQEYRQAVEGEADFFRYKLSALSDAPLPAIVRHVLHQKPVERPVKFILNYREPMQWAKRRLEEHPHELICRFDTSTITGRVGNPLCDYLECVTAAQHALNKTHGLQISDVFYLASELAQDKLAAMMEHYQEVYVQEVMNHYFSSVNEKIEIGRNVLLINYFNSTLNGQTVSSEEMNIGISEFLKQKR